MEETSVSVGVTLAQVRKERGITQAGLAKLAGLSASAIAMYETGRRKPDDGAVQKLATALQVNLAELALDGATAAANVQPANARPTRAKAAGVAADKGGSTGRAKAGAAKSGAAKVGGAQPSTMEANREQTEAEQADREQADREQADREQADREQADRQQTDREQTDREQTDREQADREQTDREQADRQQADRQQADRQQADRQQANREQAHTSTADAGSLTHLALSREEARVILFLRMNPGAMPFFQSYIEANAKRREQLERAWRLIHEFQPGAGLNL